MKQFIKELFISECIRGEQIQNGGAIVDALLALIPEEKINQAVLEAINVSEVNPRELKAAIESQCSPNTANVDVSSLDNDKVVCASLAQYIDNQQVSYGKTSAFIELTKQAEITRTLNRFAKSSLKQVCEYALSVADFGEDDVVNQTGGTETESDPIESNATTTIYWENMSDDENADSIQGGFSAHISEDKGLLFHAYTESGDVLIKNLDEVIALTSQKFNIPAPLIM